MSVLGNIRDEMGDRQGRMPVSKVGGLEESGEEIKKELCED